MNIQTLTNSIKNDYILNNLASFFENKIYLVGGSVRDAILGKSSYDRDLIVTDCDAGDFALKVSEFFDGVFVPLDEENKIYRVVLKNKQDYMDITNPAGGSLEDDILRRDLTINAIAADIRTGEIPKICEPFFEDLNNKIIREISEENFIDDPLRLLRIFRFYSVLGFEISPKLIEIVRKHKNLINNPAKERVEYEIMKLFDGEYADLALLKMDECGILEILFPFVKELKQVPPNSHHHLDLFYHSIEVVKQVGILYKNSSEEVKKHLQKVDFGGFSRLAHLRLACFMHDIGKFSTWTIEEDTGRHRFIKHEDIGAKMCVPILKKLCFSNKQIEYISYIIKKHMYPSAVVSSPELSEKVMMRYIRKSEDNAIDNILIAQADRLSARGPEITDVIVNENISALNDLLEYYLDKKETLKPLPKLLDGNDVMKLLKIKPSPKLGKILEALYEGQISGDILTKDDAVQFVLSLENSF
ncbi:HD domain-containing protein [bacterium]|nr:HD domain-containing protein [bacterium]